MTGTYQNNKISIQNWVAKNKDKKKAYDAIFSQRYWQWKKISKTFRMILIDEPF